MARDLENVDNSDSVEGESEMDSTTGDDELESGKVLKHSATVEAMGKLNCAVWLAVSMVVIELVGGKIANSLVILSDATHMLSDVAGFIVSIVSLRIIQKEANMQYTYGYRQAEIVGALISIAIVWGLTVFLVIEAVERFFRPEKTDPRITFFIACLGLLFNLVLMKVLGHGHAHDEGGGHGHSHGGEEDSHGHGHGGAGKNLALNAAVVHVVGDIVQSIGVILAAGLMWWQPFDIGHQWIPGEVEPVSNWNYADPCCTILFAFLVMMTTRSTAMATLRNFMARAPKRISTTALKQKLEECPHVKAVHDFHVWGLGSKDVICTAHLVVEGPQHISKVLRSAVSAAESAGVTQPTFQTEMEGEDGWTCDGPRILGDHGHCHGHGHGGHGDPGGRGDHCHSHDGGHGHGGHGEHSSHGHAH